MTPGGRSEVKNMRKVKSQEGSIAGSMAGRSIGNLAGSIAGRIAGRIAGAQPGRHKEGKEAERVASHTKIMNEAGNAGDSKIDFLLEASFALVSLECWGNTSNNGRRAG